MKSSHATAAAQIRAELKSAFPGIKFRVNSESYSGGDSVRVRWNDGPSSKSVTAIISKYQYGSFNGMEDIYEYDNRQEGIEQVKYVFEEREVSAEIKKALQEELHITDDEMRHYANERRVYQLSQERSYDLNGNPVVPVAEEVAPEVITESPREKLHLSGIMTEVPGEDQFVNMPLYRSEALAEHVAEKMNEVLDVIFTHENGQNRLTIPLASLLCLKAFGSKHILEMNLLAFYYCGSTFREVAAEFAEPNRLVKISTCIYTNSDFLPDWYGDWNGKFYYDI